MSSSKSIDHTVVVSDDKRFPESRWKEGVLYFLFGRWGNKPEVANRPKIRFGNVSIVRGSDGYYTYGIPDLNESENYADSVIPGNVKIITASANFPDSVEVALAQFVKDNKVTELVITFADRRIMLWKKRQRGQYGITSEELSSGSPDLSEALPRAEAKP